MLRIKSFLQNQWWDDGTEIAQVHAAHSGVVHGEICGHGVPFSDALSFARSKGGPALRALTFTERGALLRAVCDVLNANRERYAEFSRENNGATQTDTFLDVDGGIGTLKYIASLGKRLGETRFMTQQGRDQITKAEDYQAIHCMMPMQGVALHINAFNFPAWGMLEKLGPAILAGVPVVIKPATATLPVAYAMAQDIVDAEIFPEGAFNFVAGAIGDLVDHLEWDDVVAFTGSATTAQTLKTHPVIVSQGVRMNIEADSLNSCILGSDVAPGSDHFKSFIREVVKEMTIKAGQKCTAIRRVFVPAETLDSTLDSLVSSLSKVRVGDPSIDTVTMGPLANAAQVQSAEIGLAELSRDCELVFDGAFEPTDAMPGGFYFSPKILVCQNPSDSDIVHHTEIFGPVVTVMPYSDQEELETLVRKGQGSLVSSIFTNSSEWATWSIHHLGSAHGRLLIVNDAIARSHSGHGNVMPMCNHGGPGRAGGGQELGGLRSLSLYQNLVAVQSDQSFLDQLESV